MTGRGVISYEFDMTYNPAVIQPQASPVDVAGTISDGMFVTTNSPSPGLLKVVVFTTTPRVGSGTLFNLKFTAIGSAPSSSPLTWTRFMFNEDPALDVTIDGLLTLIGPTGAGATVGGRLMTSLGQPVSHTRVTMIDMNGEKRTTLSTSFGFYRFYEVLVGQTYVVTVESKSYVFLPQAVTIGQDLITLDLIAEQ
jgi:hypothetical protein